MDKQTSFKAELFSLLELCNNFKLDYNDHTATEKNKNNYIAIAQLIPILEKETALLNTKVAAPTTILSKDSWDDGFDKLIKTYEEKCTDGTLTNTLAKELKGKMRAILTNEIVQHNDLTAEYKKTKDADLGKILQENILRIKERKAKIAGLNTDCITDKHTDDIVIDAPFHDLMSVSELDVAFENVIEFGIKMDTGANPEIADNYKSALDSFRTFYDSASAGEQKKWKQAKEEVEKQAAVLKEKMDKAAAVKADWMKNVPTGGYYRYAEGKINGKKFQRLDWISRDVTIKKASKTNKNANEDIYMQTTNRIIIELYIAESDGKGGIKYTSNGETYAPSTAMLQLFGLVSNPYTTEPEGKIPALEAGEPKKGLDWSEIIYSPEPKIATEQEIPDWTDGKVIDLIAEYKKRCAEGMTGTEARTRKTEMLAEIVLHQENLINQLNQIHLNQGQRKDTEILLSIWHKKMEMWKNEVRSLKEGCIPGIEKPKPCQKFATTLQLYQTKCADKKLTPTEAQQLGDTMKECLENSKKQLIEFDLEIQKLRDIKNKDKSLNDEIKKHEAEYEELKKAIESDENELNSLEPYSEDNCISFKESSESFDIPFEQGKFNFDGKPDDIKDLQKIVAILKKNPRNKATLQPRTKNPKSALWGLIDGEGLVRGRKKTLEDYFKDLGLLKQITIVVNDNSYNADWDVLGTIQEYDYDMD